MKALFIVIFLFVTSTKIGAQISLELTTALAILNVQDSMVVFDVDGKVDRAAGFYIGGNNHSRMILLKNNGSIAKHEASVSLDSLDVWSSIIFTDKKCIYSSTAIKQKYLFESSSISNKTGDSLYLDKRHYTFDRSFKVQGIDEISFEMTIYKNGEIGSQLIVLKHPNKKELIFQISPRNDSIYIYDSFNEFRKGNSAMPRKIRRAPVELTYYILQEENTCVPVIPGLMVDFKE